LSFLKYYLSSSFYNLSMSEVIQPVQHLEYVPVGKVFSQHEIDNLSLRELQNRRILDPRFAGFEANFNWRDYVQLEISSDQLRAWVEGSLEQFSKTEEGQHLLRQSLAMQTFRNTGVVPTAENLREAPQSNRVKIKDGIDGNGFELNGVIELDRQEIRTSEYEAEDGTFVNFFVQSSLYHELCHSADGFFTKATSELMSQSHEQPYWQAWDHAFSKVYRSGMDDERLRDAISNEMEKNPELIELFKASFREYPAIAETNRFVVPYYGVKPRALNHGGSRDDPDGGSRFFFDIQLSESIKYDPSDTVTPPATTADAHVTEAANVAKPSSDKVR
jgi:hypothetical protein